MDANGNKAYIGKKRPNEIAIEENRYLAVLKLPNELLGHIIKLVPVSQWASLELVSRRFQDVVHALWKDAREIRLDELVYQEMSTMEPFEILDAALSKFLNRTPRITSISGFPEFSDRNGPLREATISLLVKFQHLERIDLSGENVVSVENLATFLKTSASRQCLKTLDAENSVPSIRESPRAYNAALGGATKGPGLKLESFKARANDLSHLSTQVQFDWSVLRKLVISNTHRFASEFILIIRQCTQLNHLEFVVPRCGSLPLYNELFQAVANVKTLSVLKIQETWSSVPYSSALITFIQSLGRNCRIIDLALRPCDEQIIFEIINHMPKLKSLEVAGDVRTETLIRLVTEMKELENLKLSVWFMEGVAIRTLADSLSNLQGLKINCGCKSGDNFGLLAHLRQLKQLYMRFYDLTIARETITAWARLGFGQRLESLDLAFDGGLPLDVMRDFLTNLSELRFMRLGGVTDDILKAISVSCPRLTQLEFWISPTITSDGVQTIIERCSQLKILRVIGHDRWFPAMLTVGKYRKITFITAWFC